MKKIIILLFICVSCGKTALDSPVTKQSSALLSPKEQRLVDCKTQVKWQYNNCMKLYSPYDPIDLRQKYLSHCEDDILTAFSAHCDHCDLVDWDPTKPEVIPHRPNTCEPSSHGVQNCTNYQDTYRACAETDYTYHPFL